MNQTLTVSSTSDGTRSPPSPSQYDKNIKEKEITDNSQEHFSKKSVQKLSNVLYVPGVRRSVTHQIWSNLFLQ